MLQTQAVSSRLRSCIVNVPGLVEVSPAVQRALASQQLYHRSPEANSMVKLEVGDGGLSMVSTIMIEQLTTVDISRVRGAYGRLTGLNSSKPEPLLKQPYQTFSRGDYGKTTQMAQ